jgi:hypothetical protein
MDFTGNLKIFAIDARSNGTLNYPFFAPSSRSTDQSQRADKHVASGSPRIPLCAFLEPAFLDSF